MFSLTVWLRVLCTVWLIISQSILVLPVQAQSTPRKFCNNIFYIRTHEFKNYFDFPDSPLKEVVKVTITYCSVKDGVIGDEIPYETLWYNGKQPLGCRRYRDLDILPLNQIYVYLDISSAPTIAAGANALVRILFDTALNRNSITAVEVPSGSFAAMGNQLACENFYTMQTMPAFNASAYIYLPVIDEIGDTQTLIYSGSY
jgi:hypothetical protein